jgi:monovalent cation:H+ antiporter-2, CPA2 family
MWTSRLLLALATAYVFAMAIVGPVLARFTGGPSPASGWYPPPEAT